MAVTLNVNGGSLLTVGTGTTIDAEQQLSTCEIPTEVKTTDVATYGGSTTVTGQAKRTIHLAGYQDWNSTGSVCQYLEDHIGEWVVIEFWQYGQGTVPDTADAQHPKVTGEMLCVPPKRGGTVDDPETFDITLGLRAYLVTAA